MVGDFPLTGLLIVLIIVAMGQGIAVGVCYYFARKGRSQEAAPATEATGGNVHLSKVQESLGNRLGPRRAS
jgi:flagellar basal body-associated protein FliL